MIPWDDARGQPYVSSYDSIANDRVPDWIVETIDTRNEVTVAPDIVEESSDSVDKFSKLYKNDHDQFWKGYFMTI
jgi:hypothetical protein